MSFYRFSHASAEAVDRGRDLAGSGRAKRPVVLLALAKLVLIGVALGAVGVVMPMWLIELVRLGSAESWYTLRLLALGGGAGIITLLVLVHKAWTNLVEDLERSRK
jgi:hypothetical protein